MGLHPAILNVNKQLLIEGMNFIASENIFIQIRTDIPGYDVHLRNFGLPVFTYHNKPFPEMCYYERVMKGSGVGLQSFRTILEIDMRTDQTSLLSKLKHFYLIPFKDIDQVIRALYLTNGREDAWFRFVINLQHVPRPMRSDIDIDITGWLSNFRPVGSISIIIPADGFESLPITALLTQPFNIWEFAIAVQKITGFDGNTEAPLPARRKPAETEDRHPALTQLSQLSALFTQNRHLLKRSHPQAIEFLSTLASAPLYTLLQLEYAAAKINNDPGKWRRTLLPLSTLLTSLPHLVHTQRLLTLHIHIHTLSTLGLEVRASAFIFELLVSLRMHILLQNNQANNHDPTINAGEDEDDQDLVTRSTGCGLSKKTRALLGVTKYAFDRGFVREGGWGEAWLMGLWAMLYQDGSVVVERSNDRSGSISGQGDGGGVPAKAKGKKVGLEDIWKVQWKGRFA